MPETTIKDEARRLVERLPGGCDLGKTSSMRSTSVRRSRRGSRILAKGDGVARGARRRFGIDRS